MSHREDDDEDVVDQTLEAEKQAPAKPGFAPGSASTPSNTCVFLLRASSFD